MPPPVPVRAGRRAGHHRRTGHRKGPPGQVARFAVSSARSSGIPSDLAPSWEGPRAQPRVRPARSALSATKPHRLNGLVTLAAIDQRDGTHPCVVLAIKGLHPKRPTDFQDDARSDRVFVVRVAHVDENKTRTLRQSRGRWPLHRRGDQRLKNHSTNSSATAGVNAWAASAAVP